MMAATGTPMHAHRRPSAASRSAHARGAPPSGPALGDAVGHAARRGGLPAVLRITLLLAGLSAMAAPAPTAAREAAPGATQQRAGKQAAPPRHGATRAQHVRHARAVSHADRAYDADLPVDSLPALDAPALTAAGGSPRAACLAAARRAEQLHGLPEGLLVAVALSESGLHAHALNIRGRAYFPDDAETARAMLARAGGRGMAGCVQVNAGVHARGSAWPLDAERATDWAGALLARAHAETGSWTGALARFHGGSPAGTRRVICRVRAKLEVTAPGSPVLEEVGCGRGIDIRVVRSGATMLEIAEGR